MLQLVAKDIYPSLAPTGVLFSQLWLTRVVLFTSLKSSDQHPKTGLQLQAANFDICLSKMDLVWTLSCSKSKLCWEFRWAIFDVLTKIRSRLDQRVIWLSCFYKKTEKWCDVWLNRTWIPRKLQGRPLETSKGARISSNFSLVPQPIRVSGDVSLLRLRSITNTMMVKQLSCLRAFTEQTRELSHDLQSQRPTQHHQHTTYSRKSPDATLKIWTRMRKIPALSSVPGERLGAIAPQENRWKLVPGRSDTDA